MLGLVCGLQAKRRPETSATTRPALRLISGSSIYGQKGKAAYGVVYGNNEVRYRIRPPGSAAQPARPTQLFTDSLPFTSSCENTQQDVEAGGLQAWGECMDFSTKALAARKS
jgi:hypothetical protein